MSDREPLDLDVLSSNRALGRLTDEDRLAVWDILDQLAFPRGTVIVRQGDEGDAMYLLLEGEAMVERDGLTLRPLVAGDHFGELSLVGHARRAATITAARGVRLARLTAARYRELVTRAPVVAGRLAEALAFTLAADLVAMTDRVGLLLGDRLLPRRTEVEITLGQHTQLIATGTRMERLVPPDVDGDLVVAGLIDARPVSLHAPVVSDAWIEALTVSSTEGREVFRRSASLLALSAIKRAAPGVVARLGPSLESARPIELGEGAQLSAILDTARKVMARAIASSEAFREETWTVEEARDELASAGWEDAAVLLATWRDAAVPLVACGPVYALRVGPVVPHAGLLTGVDLVAFDGRLAVTFGPLGTRALPGLTGAQEELALEARVPRFGGAMVAEQARWQAGFGLTSVGEFNRACITGRVDEIIRVAEGFHEKRIGRLADDIAARGGVRAIAIAGPSSSGKTTFNKRLSTQLEVLGLRPHALSLDDYYVDRARTPRGEDGGLDFEAVEALDLPQLREDIRALVAGATVRTPRYDFKAGKSVPGGGAELTLGAEGVLLLEGIHALNPALLGEVVPREQLFRIFLHPASTLPLDHLSRVSPHDVRLLRRIVRDRFRRAITAADNIERWPSVRRGDLVHIYPFLGEADAVFDTALVYELSVLKVYAERYLLEVPRRHPAYVTADRLRHLIDQFVTIYPEHVPPTSIVREFIGGSGFEY
ncbi:MAG: cyclic nucleotide-binding domain-containing protein [Myxococcales bacterium]|nr:cyclic nucleotide-binding domain-containing protein [Myxococcales bacterium]